MEIRIRDHSGSPATKNDVVKINTGSRDVELSRVYNGVGIETDQGHFGIAQRDSGIEVMLDGKLVWSSTSEIPE